RARTVARRWRSIWSPTCGAPSCRTVKCAATRGRCASAAAATTAWSKCLEPTSNASLRFRLAGGRRILCGLRLDAAEKRRARGLPVRATLVVFHLSLALAALAVGRQNSPAAREAHRRGAHSNLSWKRLRTRDGQRHATVGAGMSSLQVLRRTAPKDQVTASATARVSQQLLASASSG